MIFRTSNVEKIKLWATRVLHLKNFISAITARKMLKKGCQGYLVLVRDTTTEKTSISNAPVACEFLDVFPEELPSLPPHREIEFCIDVVSDTAPISIPSYQVH